MNSCPFRRTRARNQVPASRVDGVVLTIAALFICERAATWAFYLYTRVHFNTYSDLDGCGFHHALIPGASFRGTARSSAVLCRETRMLARVPAAVIALRLAYIQRRWRASLLNKPTSNSERYIRSIGCLSDIYARDRTHTAGLCLCLFTHGKREREVGPSKSDRYKRVNIRLYSIHLSSFSSGKLAVTSDIRAGC